MLVFENNDVHYMTQIQNSAMGVTYTKSVRDQSMTKADFYKTCMNEIGSLDFPMNEKMCNFVNTYSK